MSAGNNGELMVSKSQERSSSLNGDVGESWFVGGNVETDVVDQSLSQLKGFSSEKQLEQMKGSDIAVTLWSGLVCVPQDIDVDGLWKLVLIDSRSATTGARVLWCPRGVHCERLGVV